MNKNLYSKIEKNKLLHLIKRYDTLESRREDLIDPKNFIQVASLKLKKGDKFRPHMHIWKDLEIYKNIAQECWIVLEGSIKVFFYDLDKSLLATDILNKGDCSITLEGGHTFEVMTDNTRLYEIKSGPYYGQEKDKIFI